MKLENGISVSITPLSRTRCGFGLYSRDLEGCSFVCEKKNGKWRVTTQEGIEKLFIGDSAYTISILIDRVADEIVSDLNPAF